MPQCLISHEGRPLVQLYDPAQPRLERRSTVIDIVAVERVAHLQPQRVARAEPDRLGLARAAEGFPDGAHIVDPAVQLEAIFAGVTGAGDEAAVPRDLPNGKVIVGDIAKHGLGGRLQHRFGARAL